MVLAARAVLIILSVLFASLYPMQPIEAAETTKECSELLGQPRALSLLELLEDSQIRGLYFEGGNSLEVLADLLLERQHPYGHFLSFWKKYQDALRSENSGLARSLKWKVDAIAVQAMPSLAPAKLHLAVASVLFHEDGRLRGLRIRGDAIDSFRAEGGVEFMRALGMDTLHLDGAPNEFTIVQGFLSELSRLTHLEVLYLDGVRFENVAALNELGQLSQLRKFGLRLTRPLIGGLDSAILFQAISRLTQLETLQLKEVGTWIDFDVVALLKNLSDLDLSHVNLSANQLSALNRLQKLTRLRLSHSRITEGAGSHQFKGEFSTMTHLCLAHSQVSPDALLALTESLSLTHVDLSEVSSKVSWAKVWKKLSAAPQLKRLNVFRGAKLSELKGIEELKSLSHLLAGSPIDWDGFGPTPQEREQVRILRNQLPLLQEFFVAEGDIWFLPAQSYLTMFSDTWAMAGLPNARGPWSGEVSLDLFRAYSKALEVVRGHTHGPAAVVYPGHTHR